MQNIIIICLGVCCLFISSVIAETKSIYTHMKQIEIAQTPERQSRGLMFRQELCEACGMLFVYDEPQILSFWMKNTYIPLDIIFLNSSLQIIDIYRDTIPLNDQIIYQSSRPAQYVLEVNAGMSGIYQLSVGDKLQFELLRPKFVQYKFTEPTKHQPQ